MGVLVSPRRARPEAVQAVLQADEHFLAGREEQGVAVLLALLRQRGVGEQTLAHQLGLIDLPEHADTESLRVALRRYREFLDRLLAL